MYLNGIISNLISCLCIYFSGTVTREFPKSDDIRSDTYQPSDATIEKLAKASTEVSHLANRVGTAIRENPNMAQWLKPILELLLEQY